MEIKTFFFIYFISYSIQNKNFTFFYLFFYFFLLFSIPFFPVKILYKTNQTQVVHALELVYSTVLNLYGADNIAESVFLFFFQKLNCYITHRKSISQNQTVLMLNQNQSDVMQRPIRADYTCLQKLKEPS